MISKATNRNTQCYRVNIGELALGISYETIITAAYGGRRVRKSNVWGPTTGRHFSDLS